MPERTKNRMKFTEIANLKRKRDTYINNKNFWKKQISNLIVDFDRLVVQSDFKRKQKIWDQINDILYDKKAFLKSAIMTILQIIKKDRERYSNLQLI